MVETSACANATVDPAWDAIVEAAPGGDLTQTSLWAASRHQLGFHSYRISVFDNGRALLGGCIIYAKRLLPGIWAGSVPRGPLVFASDSSAASVVLRKTIGMARRYGIRLLVVQPPEGAIEVERSMMAAGFRFGTPSVAPEATTRLNLGRSNEELLQSMTSNRRRDVRSAMKANFSVREEDDLDLFYRLHSATAARQNFDAVTRSNLQAQWKYLAPNGKCTMFIARRDGTPVAGIWLTRFAGTVTYKLTGWDDSVPATHVNEALHWTAIQWARERGAHTYDFGGIDRANAELILAGLPTKEGFNRTPSFFKQRFGGTTVLLPRAQFVFTNRPLNYTLGSVMQRAFASARLRRFANQIRNGGLKR